jgi:hypothetical protein
MQFDPRTLEPLGEDGTVYPKIRILADFGELNVSNGALLSLDRNQVRVVAPEKTVGPEASGDGWKLNLKDGWKIVRSGDSGNYELAGPANNVDE